MAIISARIVRQPRKAWQCASCCRIIDEPHVRLYGYAYEGDTPYVTRCCFPCAKRLTSPKVVTAMKGGE